jgi:hypothetical protein
MPMALWLSKFGFDSSFGTASFLCRLTLSDIRQELVEQKPKQEQPSPEKKALGRLEVLLKEGVPKVFASDWANVS